RRAASRHCSSNVVSPGVFWPKTVRNSDCFRRPFRLIGAGTGAWANNGAGAVAARTAAADVDRNSLRRMGRILYSRPMKRRDFLLTSAAVLAASVVRAQRRQILLKGGCVLTL